MSALENSMKMTFVVYVDPEQGDVQTFLQHMANGFISMFEHECEAHGVTNMTPEVLQEMRAAHAPREVDPLEALFNLPDAPEPEIKENDE